ncbi:A/G-specific adenine glycosylase [Stieleria sp. TO1_6]|uniref:A/G-specific adenine glycosylase n=1 Tax=Stieleria tagensis TaxID=2956795 RepID=UPI00209B0F8F|nr:A/G-specific adenine glycosylase [Stieleria tagensis]MCO8124842.1 A/G-specific adenine glycosylase [Stieleria tagensis]
MTQRSSAQSRSNTASDVDPPHHPDWRGARWRSDLRRKLLKWFSTHAREMPWRSDPQPYRVWVSEIMLQQTQVATVLPYFERWMESFPTIADLATADEANLMRHWEGLGYYRRVRSMHAAAKMIMLHHDGVFPLDYDDVLSLPGVGRYTAGAVLSISNDAKLPVLEGNTQRVYSRWIGLRVPPADKAANALLWEFAAAMLPRQHSGQFNQAAMELGALVCTPKNPDCDNCPVLAHCKAAELGLQAEIPGKIKRVVYEDRTEFALLLSRRQRGVTTYLARPLPDGGRWAGLWDFPRPTEVATDSVDAAAQWLSSQIDADVQPGVRLKTLRHAVTKYRISLHVHQASLSKPDAVGPGQISAPWRWVSLQELDALPMSVTGRKIVKFLATTSQPILPLN